MSFRVEVSADNVSNGPHGAVGLFLLWFSAKAGNAGVAVHPRSPADDAGYHDIKGLLQTQATLCRFLY